MKTRTSVIVSVNVKKAFTLFELLIVILIIGLVYALMIQNFSFSSKSKDGLSLANLPEKMKKDFAKTSQKVTLRCFDECSKCKFYLGKKTKETKALFEKHSSLDLYTLVDESLKRLELGEFYENEQFKELCFEYSLYPNKSSDKLVLEYKDKFYLYDNLFEKTMVFSSLSEAREAWLEQKRKARDE